MDQGTQQNAGMVEQATAAAHSLANEAGALFELLSQFNIGGGKSLSPQKPVLALADRIGAKPAASPARQLTARLAGAFGRNQTVRAEDWQEF